MPYAPGESPGHWREVAEFPEYYERYFKTAMYGAMLSPPTRLVCRGPVKYVGQEALATDIANLRAALDGKDYTEAFMSAALPTGLAEHDNEYYSSREEFVTALADATREEYRAIIDAGFLIQLDDPAASSLWGHGDAEPAERDRRVGGDRRADQLHAARHPAGEDPLPHLLRHQPGPARLRPAAAGLHRADAPGSTPRRSRSRS